VLVPQTFLVILANIDPGVRIPPMPFLAEGLFPGRGAELLLVLVSKD